MVNGAVTASPYRRLPFGSNCVSTTHRQDGLTDTFRRYSSVMLWLMSDGTHRRSAPMVESRRSRIVVSGSGM